MDHQIEYRVRPVTRYIVTRFETKQLEGGNSEGGSSSHGEFNNESVAHEVAYALCKSEHERLGWDLGDERMSYPRRSTDGATEQESATTP